VSLSQVTFDTSDMARTDFLMPGGLNLFSVALPVKTDKLALKDFPKSIKTSGTCKKNFRVTIEVHNVAIKLLLKIAFAENNSAKSIQGVAKEALMHGLKSLDNVARKMVKFKDNLGKKPSKLLVVSEKLREAIFEHNAAIVKKNTTSKTLKTTQKELAGVKKDLADVRNELVDAKKEMESASRYTSRSSSSHNKTRGDLIERLHEKEQIKLDAFKQKSAILHKHKEKEERWKMDAKANCENVCTIQALGGRGNPFVQRNCGCNHSSSNSRGKSGCRSCPSCSCRPATVELGGIIGVTAVSVTATATV
jgi:hypothetical protein